MVARGYHLLSEYAAHTGIPVEHTGALLVAWNDEELDALPGLQAKAADNVYTNARSSTPQRFTGKWRTSAMAPGRTHRPR
jgi:L-2-hydroxyglutarate oxidase LhgO